MSFVLLTFAVVIASIAIAAVRRPSGGRPPWVVAMVGSELAPWFLTVAALVAGGWAVAGWAGGWAGGTALVLLGLSGIALVVAIARSFGARPAVVAAVSAFLGEPVDLPPIRVRSVVRPRDSGLEITRGLSYGPHPRHLVDRIAMPGVAGAPVIVHVHGGGWWRGHRDRQALPLLHRMARSGWVAFTPGYRVSPEATFPDHLVDVKRVLAWIRTHADDLGVDPSFVALAGGSAGGQLAALAALTAGDMSLQPGFEGGDATVQVCVPFYGVHDLVGADGRPLWPYLAGSVMKSDPRTDPEAWRRASPTRMATSDRSPFFVVHGSADTLVAPQSSRDLVAALRAAGGPEAVLFEVPGANHGFDYFRSIRCLSVVEGIVLLLGRVRARHTIEGTT